MSLKKSGVLGENLPKILLENWLVNTHEPHT